MRDALPRDERDVLIYAYYTGCRRSEILKLTWEYVDLPGCAVRLPSEDEGTGLHMKNDEGRVIPLGGPGKELYEMLQARKTLRDEICPYSRWVFFRSEDRTRRINNSFVGTPMCDFRDVWAAAAKDTGVKRLLHDLRRTGVRNLVRAGVPEAVAMRISGHKTRSVFERYNITSEADLHDAAAKLNAYLSGNGQSVTRRTTRTTCKPPTITGGYLETSDPRSLGPVATTQGSDRRRAGDCQARYNLVNC